MPVTAPADRRLRRVRISPARRRSWRRPWVTAVCAGLAIVGGIWAAGKVIELAARSPALTIARVSISGNARLSEGEVHALLDGLVGSNLLTADLNAWRRKLLAAPWVADARLRRVFPDTVAVVVSERRAAAIGRLDGVLYVLDHNGTSIEELGTNDDMLDVPIINGLATARSGELRVDESRAALAGRLLRDLQSRPDLASRVSEIDVTNVQDVVLVLRDDTVIVRLGDERFVERLQTYVDLEPHLRERVTDIDYVDLRYGERVYVRPRATNATAVTPRGRKS